MNPVKSIAISNFRTVLLALLPLALSSCITDEATSSQSTSMGPSPITLSATITSPLRIEDDSTITIISSGQVCEDSVVVESRDSNTVVYQIDNSSLTLRSKHSNCAAVYTSSSANGLNGTWQYKGSLVLGELDDEYCETDDQISSIKITDNTYSLNLKLENFCWAEASKEDMDEYAMFASVSAPDCQTLVVTDSQGNVAETILTSANIENGDYTMIRKYNGKSCRYTRKTPQVNSETCQSAYAAWKNAGIKESFEWKEWINPQEYQEYNDCVSKLGVSEELEDLF